MTRINLNDNTQSAIMKIVEGNPGALSVCTQALEKGPSVDPDSAFGGLGVLLDFDTLGLYGSKIWMLYKDVCGESIEKMMGVLRGRQLGLISSAQVLHAVESYGDGIDVDALVRQVQERLPDFWALEEEE